MKILRIHFSESGNFFLITPKVYFNNEEYKIDRTVINKLDKKKEESKNDESDLLFWKNIAAMHPSFSAESNQNYFYLKADEVMKKMWLVKFCQYCKTNGIELHGFESLKKMKYYPDNAEINYRYTSDLNWFSTEIEIKFGNETVQLKDIQKAITKYNGVVKLSDQSLGVLPEAWVQKWKSALEIGKIQDNKLKLAKNQFSILHSLYKEIKDKTILDDLQDKLQLLEDCDSIEQVVPDNKLNASLRDYQQAGLNWLVFISKFGFGGCLADDMGLGKTVQILALLSHLKTKTSTEKTHLVICPTTLLFNWQKEIEKFTPHLSYIIHWGTNRNIDAAEWKTKDIVLTSYGTITNDIAQLSEINFGAVIIDESQAIKNVESLRYKAVCLLKAEYRYAMTGTPIENNTLELFAQMNFLNPGLLGSENYFKNHFAIPIEKGLEKNKATELKKIIKPFIIRRTKEVVAKELPEKTEMVLYCEMGAEQRKIYDSFIYAFRSKILQTIDSQGMNNARFSILEALLKARQICDSPSLLALDEFKCNESIKADELLRNIKEKTHNHKVLVFSQFIGMLDIIKKRLEKEKISYSYLDGQTRDRQKAVEQFTNDDKIRVFLISLKAGGVGLNLCVADYVYLVDPWWNPAVEAQAIDRTHRIGQDKKVFAYRMICKDTIEEKILQLQEKKKHLSEDILSTEQSFIKTITKEDIEELFS
ncbi:MAG: DEAD/DEAH box helicase [Bacteroidales bacterium]|nr:DEAD/DEAH box helicase [Bacteroidales bacterium]